MHLRSVLSKNIYAAILYLICAGAVVLLNPLGYHFIPIWLPVGIAAGIVFHWGIKVIPGLAAASFLSHFLLSYRTIELFSAPQYPFSTIILMVLIEIGTLYLFHWYKEKRNWHAHISHRENEVNRFFLLSLVLTLPIFGIFLWYTHQIQILVISQLSLGISIYLAISASFLIFTPLYLSWFGSTKAKRFNSVKAAIRFFVLALILAVIALNQIFPILFSDSNISLYLIALPIIVFISINYPSAIYTTTFTVFSLAIFYRPGLADLPTSEDFLLIAEKLGFIVVAAISSLYIKEQTLAIIKVKDELKNDYRYIEDEIERQVKEYKQLNDNLFVEIEKRGIAERELNKSRKLLAEAQEISRISTWEISLSDGKFKWISHSNESLFLDFDPETSSIRTIAKKIHPEDLAKIRSINKTILNNAEDFELEIRLLNAKDKYYYFLVRGRSFSDNGKPLRILGLLMDITERKLSELELVEKEKKYQALFVSNIDPICVIDAQTIEIKDVNPAFESIYGYQRDEIIGQSYITISAQPEETMNAITFAKQKGYYRVNHKIHRRKNGDKFYLEGSLVSFTVGNNKMLFIISHDITQRKETENRLAEREQKYRSFFESDLMGMAEVSIAKQWISFNERFEMILGYSSKDLMLKTLEDITHPEDQEIEDRLFKKILTHESEGYTLEKRFISKNSSEIFCKVAVKAIKTSSANISHLIMMVDDISDRKRIEIQLKESRAQLSQAQTVAKLGSIRFNTGSNLLNLSEEAYEILGFGTKRPILTRRDFFKTILPGSQTRFEQLICDHENGISTDENYEQAILTPKGDVRYILTNFGVSRNKDNEVTEVLATLADITRIKKAEIDLQEANALKDQIFSIISHDLRSPIGGINQLVLFYKENMETIDKEEARTIIETLNSTSEGTYKLLESLLEWANAQRQQSFKPVESDLVSLVEQVLTLKLEIANAKGVTIQTHLPSKAPVVVDNEMIKTAIRNLISNSIKFTPHSGTIMVSIEAQNEHFVLKVSDTGKGIPKDILPKLFDNKSTYSSPGTDNEMGTGLGLKLVKKFVERNGGTIEVESIEGQGSTFTFTIPKLIEHPE